MFLNFEILHSHANFKVMTGLNNVCIKIVLIWNTLVKSIRLLNIINCSKLIKYPG